jgi:hypothetical protein
MHLWYIKRFTCPSYHTVICQCRNNLSDAKPIASECPYLGNHSLFGGFWFKRLAISSKAGH